MFAYDDSWTRTLVMHWLMSPVGSRDRLFVVNADQGAAGADAQGFQFCRTEQLADGPAESFDLIALHPSRSSSAGRTATTKGVGHDLQATLAAAYIRLRCGGVVSILVERRIDLSRTRIIKLSAPGADEVRGALSRAGFTGLAEYTVLPTIEAPRSIVSVQRRASRHFFQENLQELRAGMSPAGRWVRQWMVRAGVYQHCLGGRLVCGSKP